MYSKIVDSRLFNHALILVLALFYGIFIISNSVNIPFADDYPQQFETIEILKKDKINYYRLFFRQHNEHKLLTTHIPTIAYYMVFGKLNLKASIVVSLGMIICIWFLLLGMVRKENRNLFGLISVFFLFNPLCASSVWVGGSIQYYGVVLFGLLSLKLLSQKGKKALILSILSMFFGVFSMIAGIIIPLIGLVHILINREERLFRVITWVIASSIFLFLYFFDYDSPQHHPNTLFFLSKPWFSLQYALVLIGGFMSKLIGLKHIIYFVLLAAGYFVLSLITRIWTGSVKIDRSVTSFVYMLAVLGSIVVGRAGFESLGQALSERYMTYSKVLWLLGIIILVNNSLLDKRKLSVILGFCALFWIDGYTSRLGCLNSHRTKLLEGMNQLVYRSNPRLLEYPNKRHAQLMIENGMKKGYFQPQVSASSKMEITVIDAAIPSTSLRYEVTAQKDYMNTSYIGGWAFHQDDGITDKYIKIGIVPNPSEKTMYLFDTYKENTDDVHLQYGTDALDLKQAGFSAFIDWNNLPESEDFKAYLIILDAEKLLRMEIELNK